MNELKCKECGAELAQGVKECPSCGCPVEEAAFEYAEPAKAQTPKKFKINIMPVISLLLGVVIIIMGITVKNKEVSIDTYSAKNYDAEGAAFGGDFYTEIYGASDMIVDELNDINRGVEALSESMEVMANAVYYPIGMAIIAIGIGVIAVSCSFVLKKENPLDA